MDVRVLVDGGNVGSRIAAYDDRGQLLTSVYGGPASLSLGTNTLWRNLEEGIRRLARDLELPEGWLPSHLYMTLDTRFLDEPRKRLLAVLPESIQHPQIIAEGHARLVGATGGKPGICLTVGAGIVSYWIEPDGQVRAAGGWGHPVADEGSGAWLGSQLINEYVWYRDNERERDDDLSPLIFHLLEKRIGQRGDDVQGWIERSTVADLASLFPLIATAADSGDATAVSLLHRGEAACLRLISLAPADLPVYVVGSLANFYRPMLTRELGSRYRDPEGGVFGGLCSLLMND